MSRDYLWVHLHCLPLLLGDVLAYILDSINLCMRSILVEPHISRMRRV